MTCENCKYRITYQELDDNYEYDPEGNIFHVCMLTDTEVECDDSCEDYKELKRNIWGEVINDE